MHQRHGPLRNEHRQFGFGGISICPKDAWSDGSKDLHWWSRLERGIFLAPVVL
jgi:hypothetical protein